MENRNQIGDNVLKVKASGWMFAGEQLVGDVELSQYSQHWWQA
jgi:hypothetical protein